MIKQGLGEKLRELENNCFKEQIKLILKESKVKDPEIAYSLLLKHKDSWEFAANISKSGDSFVITLPKKEAKKRKLKKNAPVLVALKPLHFLKS